MRRLVETTSRFVSARPADSSAEVVYVSPPIGTVFFALTAALTLAYIATHIEIRRTSGPFISEPAELGVVAVTTFFLAAVAVTYRAVTTRSVTLGPIVGLFLVPASLWCWFVIVRGATGSSFVSFLVILASAVIGVILLVEGLHRARWLGVFCGLGAVGLAMAASLVRNNPDTQSTVSLSLLASFAGIACMYGTLVEIESTGKRSFEELLDAKRKIESEIAATEDMLHDLRSGLLSIETAMASLDDDVGEPLRTETARLRRLTAKRKRQPTEFDVVPGVRDMVRARRSTGITIDLRAPTSAQILGEETEVMAIVDNLLSNAMRHGADPVHVDIEEHAGYIQVRVSDSGRIVDTSSATSFFKRGFTSHRDGDGIGLDRARMLAELHHGTVTYEPGDDGTTSFLLTLPNSETAEFQDDDPKVITWTPAGRL